MCGITPHHIRQLTESSWEGGRQYSPNQIGDFSLDQLYFLLVKKENLRGPRNQVKTVSTYEAAGFKADEQGLIKGVSGDGKPMKAAFKGMSKAARLRAEAEARRQQEKAEAEKQAQQQKRAERIERRRRNRL